MLKGSTWCPWAFTVPLPKNLHFFHHKPLAVEACLIILDSLRFGFRSLSSLDLLYVLPSHRPRKKKSERRGAPGALGSAGRLWTSWRKARPLVMVDIFRPCSWKKRLGFWSGKMRITWMRPSVLCRSNLEQRSQQLSHSCGFKIWSQGLKLVKTRLMCIPVAKPRDHMFTLQLQIPDRMTF